MLEDLTYGVSSPRDLVEALQSVAEFLDKETSTIAGLEAVLSRILDDGSASGLPARLRIEVTATGRAILDVGRAAAGGSSYTDLGEFTVRLWHLTHGHDAAVRHELRTVANRVLRDMKPGYGGLLDLASAADRLDNLLARSAGRNVSITLLTFDVDGFGEIKDASDSSSAGRLLEAIGCWLAARVERTCVPLHLHGDEYGFYFFDRDVVDVSLLADEVMSAFAEVDFEREDAEPFRGTLKACVIPDVVVPREGRRCAHDLFEAFDRPGEADTIETYVGEASPLGTVAGSAELQTIAVWARGGVAASPSTGRDVRVELMERWLARALLGGEPTTIARTVERGRRRLGTAVSEGELSPLRVAQAVLMGILRRGWEHPDEPLRDRRLSLEIDADRQLLVHVSGECGTRIPCGLLDEGSDPCVIDAGPVWVPGDDAMDGRRGAVRVMATDRTSPAERSSCLLVNVGELDTEVLPMVAARVYVDPRASSGGGLPDLWQSSLRRIVELSLRNPNISTIVVVGELEHARETRRHLKVVFSESPDEDLWRIADRCELGLSRIKTFAQRPYRVLEGARGQLVPLLHQALFDDREDTVRLEHVPEGRMADRPLALSLRYEDEARPGATSIRVGTLSEAYPTALQMIRSVSEPFHRDSGDRRFAEIRGFQVILDRPVEAMVPWYWRDAEEDLETYAREGRREDGRPA